MPRVSVIIPVHNRATILPETLDSVLQQTYEDWECIIVDDHSTDNSLEVARSYEHRDSRFRAVSLPDPKRYVNAARNYGLSLAKGEFINFLDSDDLFAPEKLTTQVSYLDSHPDVDMVTCQGYPFMSKPGDSPNQLSFAIPEHWLDALLFQPVCGKLWPSHGPLWQKSAVIEIGGWDESVRSFTDPELNFRALAANLNIVRLERNLVYWRANYKERQSLSREFYYQRTAVHRIWDGYIRFRLVTPLRQEVFTRRLFFLAQKQVILGKSSLGLRIWAEDTNKYRVPKLKSAAGLLVLLSGRFSYRLSKVLCNRYFSQLHLLCHDFHKPKYANDT